MRGTTVVITGATSGIGQVAALRLAEAGARIALVARDPARSAATLKKLAQANPDARHVAYHGDLSQLAEMKRVGQEIADTEPQIDVLINNAGGIFLTRRETVDGLEMTFATNHMAYFVLTAMLLPRLKAAPVSRIVSTASDAHRGARLDFADLQSRRGYSAFGAYGRSKLCNILFTRELARRLADSGIAANCHHPGFVSTGIGRNNGALVALLRPLVMLFGLSPEEGAKTMIFLASSPEVRERGQYFEKCKAARPAREAQDDAAAKRLWDESAKLSGVGA